MSAPWNREPIPDWFVILVLGMAMLGTATAMFLIAAALAEAIGLVA